MTHPAETSPSIRVVRPGGGTPLPGASLVGRAEWTDGDVCVLEQTVEPGVLVAAHAHARETQGAYVLSGAITFYVDGDEVEVPEGGYVVRPAGSVHALWNAGTEPARMLEITSPAAEWQRFALELQAFHRAGDGDAAALESLAGRFGTTLHPEVTRDLLGRHRVRTAAGYAAD